MKDFRQMVDTYVLDREKHKKYLAFVLALSMMVTFAVPLSLMQPAESMTANREFLGTELARAVDADGRTLVDNLNGGQTANNGYSLGQLSEVALLIGEGDNERLEWTKNCKTAKDVVEAAKHEYFLGIASDFCVFLEGDFNIKDADAEGRVAVGGSFEYARTDNNKWNYQLGAGDFGNNKALIETSNYLGVKNFAHLIIGGIDEDPSSIKKVAPFGTKDEGGKLADEKNDRYRRFVIPTANFSWDDSNHYADDGTEVKYGQSVHFHYNVNFSEMAQFYTADLIDFEETFEWIRTQSDKLSKKTETGTDGYNSGVLTLTGPGQNADVETVYFNMDSWNSDIREVHFVDVPENANLVVNCGGKTVSIANDVKTYIGTEIISNTGHKSTNNNKRSEQILYNFYEAGKGTEDNIDEKDVYIDANFNGTILAPYANARSEDSCGGHLSGALIAKSFKGGLEFGYRPYRGTTDILGSTSGYTIPVDKFESNGSTPLPGAAFKLTITDQDDNVVTSWTSGDSTEYVTIPTMIDFTGDKVYTVGDYEEREYKVWEESAPEGYVKTDQSYQIKVTETVEELTQIDEVTLPTKVTVNIGITGNEAGNTLEPLNFTITDEYSEDAQTMRKIKIGETIYFLNMQDGKVKEVNKSVGESSVATTDIAHVYTTSIGGDALHKYTIPIEVETGTTILTDVEVPAASTEAPAVEPDESDADESGTDTAETTSTETTTATSATTSIWTDITTMISTSVEVFTEGTTYTEIETSTTEKSSYTTYTTVAVLNSEEAKTEGTVTEPNGSETKTYYFDPNSLMFMPLPFKNLTFTNDYGLLFEKTDGTNRLTGADIRLQYASDWDEPFTDVSADDWTWNSSNVTIDVRTLAVKYPGMVFRFHEETPPVGYEPADDIYFEMDDTTLKWSSDKATWQTQDITEGYATITMEDQKIHGAKLKLYKSDADNENKYLDGAVFSLYRDGVAEPIKTGITIADGEVGLDFYETFKNDPETAFIKNGYLVPGTYYLLETSTPDGYDNAHNKNHAYYFTIKDNYSVAVGKPDSIPIKIHTQTANQQYFVCDDDDKKMDWNDWGNGSPGFENVKSIRIKATPKFKIYTNIKNQFGLDGNGGKSFDSSEGIIQFDTPQNLAKLEIQCSSWDDKDLQEILLVEIQTSDGKKYVYQAPGTSGGESGSTEAEPDTEETTTTTTAAPGSEAGVNVPITLNVRSAGNQYFACDENGKALDNGNGSLTGIVSIEVVTNVNPKIFTNVSLIDGQQNSTTNKYTFNEPTTITKFEVQTPSWDNTYLEVNSIVFTTQSGKTYTYTAPVTKSKQFTLDQVNVNYPKNLDGYDKTYQFSVSDLNLTDSQGKAITQLSGFDMEFTDGIARKVVSNHQNATTWPWMQFDNVTSVSVTDTILTVQFGLTNPITDLSTIKFTAHWQEEAEAASTLTLRTTANTEKAAAAESEEASESLEIREPTTVGDRIILNIPNKFSSDFDISVTKNWDVKGNTAFIPDELALTLQRKVEGGEWQDYTHAVTVEKTTATMWTYKYAGLPIADDDGKPYYYRVRENTVPAGYTLTYNDDAENGVCKTDTSKNMQITNTLETTSHKVTKTWDKQEVTVDLPDSIQVTLQQSSNGGTTWSDFKTVTITPDNGKWEYTFEDLPAEGMSYRAHEASLNGWEANHDWSNADSTAITNTYKTGGLRIKKEWDGDNESNRPDKITVKLYRKAVAGGGSGGNAGGTVSSLNIAKVPISTKKSTGTDVYTDYSRLLQYSLYFYDANMCGDQVTENSALTWRNDCHLNDEIQGGFHDAGDHVMFGLPQGYTASTLGWSYYEFKDAYDDLGLTGHYQTIMKHFCDFFVASTDLTDDGTSVERVLFQKGVGGDGYDHGYWGDPTNQPDNYNSGSTRSGSMHWIYPDTDDGSDFTSEYAAALAQYYLNFYDIDPVTADKYLSYAEKLYAFAKVKPGPTSAAQYGSDSYTDDMAWAAGWLYLATENETYKSDLSNYVQNWTYCWSDVTLGAASMYGLINGDWTNVTNYLDGKCNNANTYYIADAWGSARYNAALQMVALVATKHTDKDYTNWCKSQMGFLLGDNEINLSTSSSTGGDGVCFIVGFADNSSKNPHHRASSGYNSAEEKGTNTQHASGGKTLVGALVGGPSNGGHREGEFWTNHYYYDNMQDYCCNEVALDYNAGLVGAAAGLYHFYKNDAAVNKTFSLVTDTTEIDTKGGIETAYPAVVPTAQSLTLSPQQSEKANAIKGIAKVGSEKVAKAAEPTIIVTGNVDSDNGVIKLGNITKQINKIKVQVDAAQNFSNGVNDVCVDVLIGSDWNTRGIIKLYADGRTETLSDTKNCSVTATKTSDFIVEVTPNSPLVPNGNFVKIGMGWNKTIYVSGYEISYTDGSTLAYGTFGTPVFAITPSKSEVTEGDTLTLTASVSTTNNVQWSCNSNAITITPTTGNEVTITAQSVTEDTTVTITAKDGTDTNAPTATAQITIKPKELTFSIDVTQVRVNGGEKTVTLTATPSDNVRFTRSDGIQVTDNVITVNPTEVGELTITATRGSTSTTQTIEFIGDPFIEGENTMNVGDNQTLKLQNAIGTVTWALQTASDIVTISDTGEVTALKNGTVTVVATDSYDKKTAEFSITVDLFALDVDTSGMEEVDTLTLTKANDWTYTLQNLPITDEQGNAYVYYIEEVLDPATNTLTTPSAVYVPIDYAGNGIQLEENAGTKEMTVTNKLKSSVETTGQMPSAGGEGNGRYYMAGAAMMLAGIAGYFVLKRRQRSRADA